MDPDGGEGEETARGSCQGVGSSGRLTETIIGKKYNNSVARSRGKREVVIKLDGTEDKLKLSAYQELELVC